MPKYYHINKIVFGKNYQQKEIDKRNFQISQLSVDDLLWLIKDKCKIQYFDKTEISIIN